MLSKTTLSRRALLKGLATAAALRPTTSWVSAKTPTAAPREKLSVFRYSDVRLTGGPLKDQFDRIHASYLNLGEDRLLKAFRRRAGLNAPGEDMGGWYDPEGFAPGHCFGQFVSGLARFTEATGDATTQAKVQRLVDGFTATIGSDGFAYMCSRAASDFPAYILDKYMIGLLDAARFAGVSTAKDTLERVIEGSLRYLPAQAMDQDHRRLHSPYDESYTLPENFFYAYEATGKDEYRELGAKYLMDESYFDPLSRGENPMVGKHAYSHVNCLSSAARAYQVVGEPKYFQVIQNAWNILETSQEYASGGWGPNESFVPPGQGKLGESLTTSHAHFETPCGAYAHMKLARYLLRFTGDARYGDGLERVLYNTVLGAKDPKGDGYFFYYSDYHPSTKKNYHPDKWPCCAGTLPQAVTDYVISSYFRAADGIVVNLFTPSELRWKQDSVPVTLVQTTSYPESDSTELRLELATPAEFTMHIRIPGWLRSSAQITINGKPADVKAEHGTFAAVHRRWQNHDTVQVTLPFAFQAKPVDDRHPNLVAVMRGPVMLVALQPPLKVPRGTLRSPGGIKPTPHQALSFEAPSVAENVRFVPFYTVKDEVYTTYITEG